MKKLLILFLILLIAITTSCQTVQSERPPRPKREPVQMPANISKDAAKLIIYYALKLEEWEAREDLIEEAEK